MPRAKTATKKTTPVKKTVRKVAKKAPVKKAPRKVAPKVEEPRVEEPKPLTKIQRMAQQTPKKTWANVQETDMRPRSWGDWSREQLDQNKI